MRKVFLIVVVFSLLMFSLKVEAYEGKELGLMIGGGFDLKDSTNAFTLLPYYSTPLSENNEFLRFVLPLSITFATGMPAGTSLMAIQILPGIEYDIPIYEEMIFISPTGAFSLGYQATDILVKIHTFGIGFLLGLQAKFFVTDNFNIRFLPTGIAIRPWRYSNAGIGSQTNVVVSYQLFGGVGYVF